MFFRVLTNSVAWNNPCKSSPLTRTSWEYSAILEVTGLLVHFASSYIKYMLSWSRSILSSNLQGPVSRKSRELFGPEKPFVKVRPAYSVKLVFSYVVKGIKTKITAKFRASRRFRFEDTKRIMPPEIRPKSFGTFEKQAPGHQRFFSRAAGIFGVDQRPTQLRP